MLQIGNMKTFAGRKMPTHLLYQSDKDFKNLNIQYLLFIIQGDFFNWPPPKNHKF